MAAQENKPRESLDEFKAKLQKVTDWYSANKDILKMTAKERLEMDERGQMDIDDPYGARKVMKQILDREMVNHPDHYQGSGGMEVIDIIENYDLGFSLGNAIKYILRSNKKSNAKQDLEKAIWYIQREIRNLVEEEDCEDL
jgi:translation initiation factor 2B subunit (eIF-2B alpha/beta/delta family)